jgi:copper resistance protein B
VSRAPIAAAALLLALAWPRPAAAQHQHEHPSPAPPATPAPASTPSTSAAPSPVPPLTDADRQAAFPDVHGHAVHGEATHVFVLADQLEWAGGDGRSAVNWDVTSWIGGDVHRLWIRSEGEGDGDGVDHGEAQVLYGRAISPWWDLVAGVRHDAEPGPSRTWVAMGVQGLAPYRIDVEATAFLGGLSRTLFRLEAEYELLITNRLVLQPLVEVDIYGKDDLERGIGAGLSTTSIGLRLRREIRREFAPYVGVSWDQKHFGTADLARAAGERVSSTRFVAGVRLWH